MSIVRARDGLNLQIYSHKIYRAKGNVVEEMESEWNKTFLLLVPHLVELRRVDPASVAALVVDQGNQFFLLFSVF